MAWLRWLDSIPWVLLLIAAAYLTFAPFHPEPHLVEKLRMLVSGTLIKPIDIFDFLLHGTPSVLVVLKGLRHFSKT